MTQPDPWTLERRTNEAQARIEEKAVRLWVSSLEDVWRVVTLPEQRIVMVFVVQPSLARPRTIWRWIVACFRMHDRVTRALALAPRWHVQVIL